MIKINKEAFIKAVTAEKGIYMDELLFEKDYKENGLKRCSSFFNNSWINYLYQQPNENNQNFFLNYGDFIDIRNILKPNK